MSYGKKARPHRQKVCPAGMRDDIPRRLNLPCPDEDSLEEEYQWRQEYIQ